MWFIFEFSIQTDWNKILEIPDHRLSHLKSALLGPKIVHPASLGLGGDFGLPGIDWKCPRVQTRTPCKEHAKLLHYIWAQPRADGAHTNLWCEHSGPSVYWHDQPGVKHLQCAKTLWSLYHHHKARSQDNYQQNVLMSSSSAPQSWLEQAYCKPAPTATCPLGLLTILHTKRKIYCCQCPHKNAAKHRHSIDLKELKKLRKDIHSILDMAYSMSATGKWKADAYNTEFHSIFSQEGDKAYFQPHQAITSPQSKPSKLPPKVSSACFGSYNQAKPLVQIPDTWKKKPARTIFSLRRGPEITQQITSPWSSFSLSVKRFADPQPFKFLAAVQLGFQKPY